MTPGEEQWLAPWIALIAERSRGRPVLEIGCGPGWDTAFLLNAGCAVIALDRSADSIAEARRRAPQARYHCQDMRKPLPVAPGEVGAVLASLSLHYFSWDETQAVVSAIREALCAGGVLICRVNSTRDHHYGAMGHPQIAENYYRVDGRPKRFFDQASLERLFSRGWTSLAMAERTIDRYAMPKVVWELALERAEVNA